MRIFYLAFSCFLLLTGCSSSTPEIKDDESASTDVKEIKKVVDAFGGWIVDKDSKALKGMFTIEPEAIVYSVSSEVWKGESSIRKKMTKDIDKIEDGSYDARDQVVKVAGNIAWFSQRADMKYDYDGQRVAVEGLRMTGVLIKEEGKWKIAQWHSSYPVRTAQQQQQQE